MNHCEAGWLVGKKWGFPQTLCQCMEGHHAESPGAPGHASTLVQLSCRMADAMGYPEIQYRQAPDLPELPASFQALDGLRPERLKARIQTQIDAIGK